ncbi:hypothetical protein E0H86_05945 [Acinetobacter sp. ANC 4635]|uniref:hypothetical protein n=1 Tax=Acinetobacter sp. ANC 4635 TaxID=2529846 RepID=UPI00103AC6CB|nr:hypothetical protein [Acinetobacter sp. ANC 4635]TCB31961.1 hypothetical protein E0H86_05945 [Acinetobacter sp. ANC 4635]
MKIGFLGGFKHGKSETYEFDKDKELSPPWIMKKEDTSNVADLMRAKLDSSNGSSTNGAIVFYKLMVLRRDGEAKFFYVEPTQTKDQINEAIKEHWGISTTIGYDFS